MVLVSSHYGEMEKDRCSVRPSIHYGTFKEYDKQHLLMIDVRDSSIVLEMNIKSRNVSISSVSNCNPPYLSGLKSLVTIIPGSITRVSLGRSCLANDFAHQLDFMHISMYCLQ